MGYHTEFFHYYRDPRSIMSIKFGPTGGSEELYARDYGGSWVSRLGSMNLSLGCHPQGLLLNRIWHLAKEKNFWFVVDGHNGGGDPMTSVACVECGAVCKIEHEGLPAKGGARPSGKLLKKVNQQLTKFFWTKEAIHRRRLLTLHGRYTCTIEWHNPGRIINHDADENEDEYEFA